METEDMNCTDWRINRCARCGLLGKIVVGETYCAACKKQLTETEE